MFAWCWREGTLKKAPLLPHQLNIEHKGPDGVSSPLLVVGNQLCMYFVSAERRRTRDLFDIDCPILNEKYIGIDAKK